jgi:hypothetical protein
MSEPTKVPLRSSRIGRGPLNSGITPGLRHGAVVTCTECAVGVIDHPSGGVSAPVPSAWFWQVKRAGTKAGAVGCVLAPDSTSVPLPTLVRALVPLIVPENVVSCCRCRPPACPGLIVVTPNTCLCRTASAFPPVLARLKVPACPPLPPELAWSAMILETIWGCPAPGLEGDGAARARKEDAGAEARAIAAALDPAAGSDRVAIDGERAAEASGCYPTARRSRHPYRHLRHGCADAAAEAALPSGTAASGCRASRNPG